MARIKDEQLSLMAKKVNDLFQEHKINSSESFFNFLKQHQHPKKILENSTIDRLGELEHTITWIVNTDPYGNPCPEEEDINTLKLIYFFAMAFCQKNSNPLEFDIFEVLANLACKYENASFMEGNEYSKRELEFLFGQGATQKSVRKTGWESDEELEPELELELEYHRREKITKKGDLDYLSRLYSIFRRLTVEPSPTNPSSTALAAHEPHEQPNPRSYVVQQEEQQPHSACTSIMTFLSYLCCCGNKNQDADKIKEGLLKSHPTSAQS